nr:reverse transcriptase domain-containing protein [Bradyrhizobium sp. CCBAU 51765]
MLTYAASSTRSIASGCCGWWRTGSPDPLILRLIGLWLRAGVLESGEKQETDRGTPQGASISPLLANIFLHYILDLWVHQWRRRHARGRVVTARCADDFVVGFESKADAQEMLWVLNARLAGFGPTLHEDKTRLIDFGRFAALSLQRRCEPRTTCDEDSDGPCHNIYYAAD